MEELKPEMNDDAITELISKKIVAEDVDSGWVLAWTMLRALPVLNEIVNRLDVIRWVLGEDIEYQTGGYRSPQIATQLKRIADLCERIEKGSE